MCSYPSVSPPISFIIPRYLVIFIGLFANIFLVFGLFKDPLKCFRNSSSHLIMNLAISDILTNLLWFLVQYWKPCINGFSLFSVVYLPPYISCCSITTMAFDRYMSCVHPCKYRIWISRNVTLIIILFQWSVSIGLLAIETIYQGDIGQPYLRGGMVLLVVISGAMMYCKAAYVLKNNSRYFTSMAAVSTTAQNRTQNARLKNERRLFTTMFLVSFITIITLIPLGTYMILLRKIYVSKEYMNYTYTLWSADPVHTWLTTLFFVNFSVNPFVYTWRLKNYRKTFKVLLRNVGFHCFRKTRTFEQNQVA